MIGRIGGTLALSVDERRNLANRRQRDLIAAPRSRADIS
jgi:hypothetical protein